MLNKNYIQKLASSRSKKAEPKRPPSQIKYTIIIFYLNTK